ncbi:MAG: STAS domain-containing protein, partial [Thiolinea sp.]
EASFLLLFSLQIAATYRARALHGALALAIADKDDLIAELSTPVIHVWNDTVCVPVIGSIEAERATQMTGALLDAVTSHGLRHVIVDFTGIATMDTQTVRHFTNLARAIGLLGASCAFTGISAPVAQVLVSIGVDLGAAVGEGGARRAHRRGGGQRRRATARALASTPKASEDDPSRTKSRSRRAHT